MIPTQKQALLEQASSQKASLQQVLPLMGQDSLRAICAAPGPFITVFLPACHPGTVDFPRAGRMKTIVREAALELERRRFSGSISQILKPLEDLAENPGSLGGGSDSVIFASPGSFRHFRLLAPTHEGLTVASHPYITPLLALLMPQQEFYVLAVAKKQLRLGRWYGGRCTEIPLPPGVPKSFEETLAFDTPDHDLQGRSASGTGSTQMGTERFGTGSERDLVHERLRHYLHLVDRKLTGLLMGAPLVLVGVAQELTAYRSVAKYPRVLAAKPTSPEHLSWTELGELARESVLEARRGEAESARGEFLEEARRDRLAAGVHTVLEAAQEGRVHKLLVEQGATDNGLMSPVFAVDSTRLEGEQDRINAAAVETIRNRGEVYMLDPGKLERFSPIAAILRFSERVSAAGLGQQVQPQTVKE